MSFTAEWDETKPAGTRSKLLGDDDIREFKQQVRERMAVDHYALATESADPLIGYHKKATLLEQASDPAAVADALILYTKLADSYSDLYGRHENAGVQRLTRLGKLWISALGAASEARGDLIVRGASLWDRVALGASGTYLKSDGTDAAWAALAVLASELPNGVLVHHSYVQSVTYEAFSGYTAIPQDDTPPQSNEGALVSTLTITHTPKSATNILEIVFIFSGSVNGGGVSENRIMGSIFKDTDTDCLEIQGHEGSDAELGTFRYSTLMVAGGTSAIDFKLRVGNLNGTAIHKNGTSNAGARRYGGKAKCMALVREYKAA